MRDKRLAFRCYHSACKDDEPLELIVTLPDNQLSSGGTKEKLVYCERNHMNLITIPDTWDIRSLVLGDDILWPQGGVPIVQGRKP